MLRNTRRRFRRWKKKIWDRIKVEKKYQYQIRKKEKGFSVYRRKWTFWFPYGRAESGFVLPVLFTWSEAKNFVKKCQDSM